MTNRIIDVSHWEEPIDFKQVRAAGIVAIIGKATNGASGVDRAYSGYKKAAARYRFLWGSYHFGTGSEVTVQVDSCRSRGEAH
jgi:lysozyme